MLAEEAVRYVLLFPHPRKYITMIVEEFWLMLKEVFPTTVRLLDDVLCIHVGQSSS
jgi:hypothetical protein